MCTQTGYGYHLPTPLASSLKWPGWTGVIERYFELLRQQRQRQALAALDDRLLDDIGITREQALKAARRAWWN